MDSLSALSEVAQLFLMSTSALSQLNRIGAATKQKGLDPCGHRPHFFAHMYTCEAHHVVRASYDTYWLQEF